MNIEEKFFKFALGLICLSVLLAMLTSCDPYAGLQTATPTAVSIVTAASPPVTSLVQAPSSTPLPSCTVATGIPAGYLNLRTGAGIRYAVIRVLREGETLKVVQRAAWLKVIDAKGTKGFVSARYCQ